MVRCAVYAADARVNNLYGSNIFVQNTFIEANTMPGHGFPFNTDGFDVAGTNVTIDDFVIQNGDDAVTIENGASNVMVSNGMIGGPGCHGTSIGSLGEAPGVFNTVSNGEQRRGATLIRSHVHQYDGQGVCLRRALQVVPRRPGAGVEYHLGELPH